MFALTLAVGVPASIGVLLSLTLGVVLMPPCTIIVAINAPLLQQADLTA